MVATESVNLHSTTVKIECATISHTCSNLLCTVLLAITMYAEKLISMENSNKLYSCLSFPHRHTCFVVVTKRRGNSLKPSLQQLIIMRHATHSDTEEDLLTNSHWRDMSKCLHQNPVQNILLYSCMLHWPQMW